MVLNKGLHWETINVVVFILLDWHEMQAEHKRINSIIAEYKVKNCEGCDVVTSTDAFLLVAPGAIL